LQHFNISLALGNSLNMKIPAKKYPALATRSQQPTPLTTRIRTHRDSGYRLALKQGERLLTKSLNWLPPQIAKRFVEKAAHFLDALGAHTEKGLARTKKIEKLQTTLIEAGAEVAEDVHLERLLELSKILDKLKSYPAEYLLSLSAAELVEALGPLQPGNKTDLLGIVTRLQQMKRHNTPLAMAVLLDDHVKAHAAELIEKLIGKGKFAFDQPENLGVHVDSVYLPGNCWISVGKSDFIRICAAETKSWHTLDEKRRSALERYSGIGGVMIATATGDFRINLVNTNALKEASPPDAEPVKFWSKIKFNLRHQKYLTIYQEMIGRHEAFHAAHQVIMPDDFHLSGTVGYEQEAKETLKAESLAMLTCQDDPAFTKAAYLFNGSPTFIGAGYDMICRYTLKFNYGSYAHSLYVKRRQVIHQQPSQLDAVDREIKRYIRRAVFNGLAAQVLWPNSVGRWMLTLSDIDDWSELVDVAIAADILPKDLTQAFLNFAVKSAKEREATYLQIEKRIQQNKTLSSFETLILFWCVHAKIRPITLSMARMLEAFHATILVRLEEGHFPVPVIASYNKMMGKIWHDAVAAEAVDQSEQQSNQSAMRPN